MITVVECRWPRKRGQLGQLISRKDVPTEELPEYLERWGAVFTALLQDGQESLPLDTP
jgi:hypothetical protein